MTAVITSSAVNTSTTRTANFSKFTWSEPGLQPDDLFPSPLHGYAIVYTLGDKYEIPGLKKLAKCKFEDDASEHLNVTNHGGMGDSHMPFLNVLPYIYTHTAPNEMGLRDSVVKVWRQAPSLNFGKLGRAKVREFVEQFPDVAVDLIERIMCMLDEDDSVKERHEHGNGEEGSARGAQQ